MDRCVDRVSRADAPYRSDPPTEGYCHSRWYRLDFEGPGNGSVVDDLYTQWNDVIDSDGDTSLQNQTWFGLNHPLNPLGLWQAEVLLAAKARYDSTRAVGRHQASNNGR
jgi:hypothetical protein